MQPINNDLVLSVQDVFYRKPYKKIDSVERLNIINAIDNGRAKMDLAREYGVHPQIVAHIYKQRKVIIQKYKAKLATAEDVRFLNLDVQLIDWFKQMTTNISEDALRNKALEILSSANNEIEDLDTWLKEFKLRHNIVKHRNDPEYTYFVPEWLKLTNGFHENDVYVAGTFSLYHRLNLEGYMKEVKQEDYITVFFACNTTGSDKKKLAIFGSENINESGTSLPFKYYYNNNNPLANFKNIYQYLKTWDNYLISVNQCVLLLMSAPESFCNNMVFENIRVIPLKRTFLKITIEKIIHCFKYQYRKLQITKTLTNITNNLLINYLNLVNLAWYGVPTMFIKTLLNPPPQGSLTLVENENFDSQINYSLSEWSRSCFDDLLSPDVHDKLDELVTCDNDLCSLDVEINADGGVDFEDIPQNDETRTSSVEAYQAMKRLISFLQSEGAESSLVETARILEDHLECEALTELHEKNSHI